MIPRDTAIYIYTHIYIYMCVCEPIQSVPKKLPSNGEEKHKMPWDKRLMAFATSAYLQAKTKVPSIVSQTLTKLLHCPIGLYR